MTARKPKTDKPKDDAAKDEKVAEQVQSAVDVETEQGFRGVRVDPTPNEAYTVEGVTSGAPTPETDEKAAAAALKARADVSKQA